MQNTLGRFTEVASLSGARFEQLERALAQMERGEFLYRSAKLGAPILLCGVAAGAIMLLWHQPLVLAGVVLALAFVKHKLFPLRFEWLAFTAIAFLGAYAEAEIIRASGAWYYPEWQIAQIPIWLPPLWGLAGISLITAYLAWMEPVP